MEATENKQSYLSTIFIVSLSALLTAFGAEYIFGFKPCILCIYERIPYICTSIISGFARLKPGFAKPALALCFIAFLSGSGLAFYHTGIEHHFFAATDKCNSSSTQEINTIEDMRQQIMSSPLPSCSEPAFIFLRLSFTEWNLVLSLLLAIYSIYACTKYQYGKT